jgi:predicted RND superfamily exporter protein
MNEIYFYDFWIPFSVVIKTMAVVLLVSVGCLLCLYLIEKIFERKDKKETKRDIHFNHYKKD